MTDIPETEKVLIAETYKEIAAILNERIIRNRSVDRLKVSVALMSITTAWVMLGVSDNPDKLNIAEEAFVRSLKLHFERKSSTQTNRQE